MPGVFSTRHVNEILTEKVSDPVPFATQSDLQQVLPTQDFLRYVRNDVNVADVTSLLGRVFYENKGSKKLIPFIIPVTAQVDEKSILTAPQVLSELIIDSRVKASVDALSYLSMSVNAEELLELRVINNSAARAQMSGDSWSDALTKWMTNPMCIKLIESDNVGIISVVTGVVQKYLTSKKYKKFDANAKGGGMGVNAEGSLYTSTSQFDLTVIYGLELIALPGVSTVNDFAENILSNNLVRSGPEIKEFRVMFDEMATTHDSVFRISSGQDF